MRANTDYHPPPRTPPPSTSRKNLDDRVRGASSARQRRLCPHYLVHALGGGQPPAEADRGRGALLEGRQAFVRAPGCPPPLRQLRRLGEDYRGILEARRFSEVRFYAVVITIKQQ